MKWIVFAILLMPNQVEETVYAQQLTFNSQQECVQALQYNAPSFLTGLTDYLDWTYGIDHGIVVTNIDCIREDGLKKPTRGTNTNL